MFENFKLNRQIKQIEKENKIKELEILNSSLSNMEARARQAPVSDPDENMWIPIGGDNAGIMPGDTDVGYNHFDMLKQAYKLWTYNLFARAIVRNLSKFVLGRGPLIKPKTENKKVNEAWQRFCRLNKWGIKEKEMVQRVFRDGEIFMRKFVSTDKDGKKYRAIRFLRANNIKNPISTNKDKFNSDENVTMGIGTNKEDIEDVKTYYYVINTNGLNQKVEKIPADEIIHIKILVDSDVKRGMSFLLVSMGMIKKYMNWLDDRIDLNRMRSAVALIKKVEGNRSAIESIRDAQQTEHKDIDRHRSKMPRGATVITASKGIEYEMKSPNINAPDVKDDGRAMLLAIAAGSGMPEMVLTSDYSNANYSSSMVAQNPFVREIEDWQDFFAVYYDILFRDVIAFEKEYGEIPDDESEESTIEFPPLILADIEKNNKAREIQHRNKIISKKTWQQKEALDPDVEERNMEDEQGKDVYSTPFNMPTSPTNQWG